MPLLLIGGAASGQSVFSPDRWVERRAVNRLDDFDDFFLHYRHLGHMGIDSIVVMRRDRHIAVHFSPAITHLPMRVPWLLSLETGLMNSLGWVFRNYSLSLLSGDNPLTDFVPNHFRNGHIPPDTLRIRPRSPVPALVRKTGQPGFEGGLSGNHIALWHSHGYYYNAVNDRWQWQRARLFGTVEDMLTADYVLGYVAPMLENAGANVLLPRERDVQVHEVIIGPGIAGNQGQLLVDHGQAGWKQESGGFDRIEPLTGPVNPFDEGVHLKIPTNQGGSLTYVPDIPASGKYAVYFSWAKTAAAVPDARLDLSYAGGTASFEVNQAMGHGTWVYLGHFYFKQGLDSESGRLQLLTHSAHDGVLTAGAVRFGGGMGSIARGASGISLPNRRSDSDRQTDVTEASVPGPLPEHSTWRTSGRPRYQEGARYYLQYAGMPDTLVYSLNEGRNDYNDDYMSRGEWVNFLMGAPFGPQNDRNAGLGIPIDLSLSFHTDAGVTPGDSVIGTLAIYSAERDGGMFPDGVSRLAGRDLSDMVQDQIVSDIRAMANPDWTRRALWDRAYSEAWRPNVPAMLLELYSHQNLADISYGLDPRFQFMVGRAIYKGILRFLAGQEGREAVVKPLPPDSMAIRRVEGKTIMLSWRGAGDKLEDSAVPSHYKIYQRAEGAGFCQGWVVSDPYALIELPAWHTIYSYKVTALNSGGESFPSEILSVALLPGQQEEVLVVNGFDRLSGPQVFDTGQLAGRRWWGGMDVPLGHSVAYTGMQYDFDRGSPWLDDDSPGCGASYADWEGRIRQGNSFDYPSVHGKAIRNAGYSFVSVSRKAFEAGSFTSSDYWAVNLVAGLQKGIPEWPGSNKTVFRVFSPPMREGLRQYALSGGNILVSGAYTGTDMIRHNDAEAVRFAEDILGFLWRSDNASNTPGLTPTAIAGAMGFEALAINTGWHPLIYTVGAPDAIEAVAGGGATAYRYAPGKSSAAVLYQGGHKAFSMGFPFEAIIDEGERDYLMKQILNFFKQP